MRPIIVALIAALTTPACDEHRLTGIDLAAGCPQTTPGTLASLKYRDGAPRSDQIDTSVTLERLVAPGDDRGRFDPTRGASVVGYLREVIGGPGYGDGDVTIWLTVRWPDEFYNAVQAEIPPCWYQTAASAGIDWSGEGLTALLGRRIQVTGWLFFDSTYVDRVRNSGDPNSWRRTAWEIHPMTALRAR